MASPQSSISIVIPVLNEEAILAATLARIRLQFPSAQIIVVDGGSTDATVAIAQSHHATVITSPPGRGPQLRHGAAQANGDLLLFLHADTRLPSNAAMVIAEYFHRLEVQIATFRLTFDEAHWFLRISAWFTRFDSVFTRFGDQGIIIRRGLYDALGGFPAWPLFEDVDLLRRARRQTRIWSLPAAVITSARRFRNRGLISQQWLNTRLLLRFLAGADPIKLAHRYRS